MTLELEIQRREQKAAAKAREEGRARGREEGRAKGREEGRFDMVKKLLSVKTPIEYIVAATGWSKEKILQLATDLQRK